MAGDGVPGTIAYPNKDGRGGNGVHGAVGHHDVGEGAAVHGLHAEATGTLEPDPGDGDGVVAAGGLGAKLDTGGGTAGVGGHDLIGSAGSGNHRTCIVAADHTVLDQDVLGGHEHAGTVGSLHDDGVVRKGVEVAVADGNVLAAVDIVGIPVGVHDQVVDSHVPGALSDDGKVAAVQDADAVQHHILAAHQCNGLVAVPGGAVAPVGAVFGVGGVVAGQHIDEGTGVVHVAAVDETLAVDHDIVLVSGVEQAVGKVGVAVVLEPGIEVHFRLIVVSALAHHGLVAIPVVQVCPGSPDDAVGVDAKVDAALETDGVALKVTCRHHHGAAAGLTGSLDGGVDGFSVLDGVSLRHSPKIRDEVQAALVQQDAFVHGAAGGPGDVQGLEAVLLCRVLCGKGRQAHGGHGGGHSTDLQKAAARDLFGKHNQISSFFALHDLNLDRVHLGVFAWPDCSVASF